MASTPENEVDAPPRRTFQVRVLAKPEPKTKPGAADLDASLQGPGLGLSDKKLDAYRDLELPTDLLLPEYAIGVGLITREEYEEVRRSYYTQSQWTLGLILPVIFLWIVLATRGILDGGWPHGLFVAAIVLAFVAGMDRLHNYHAQLQSLIVGKYVAKLLAKEAAEAAAAAAKPPPGTPPPPTLKDVRADIGELKTLVERELQRTPVTIIGGLPVYPPPASPPSAPSPPSAGEPDPPTQPGSPAAQAGGLATAEVSSVITEVTRFVLDLLTRMRSTSRGRE